MLESTQTVTQSQLLAERQRESLKREKNGKDAVMQVESMLHLCSVFSAFSFSIAPFPCCSVHFPLYPSSLLHAPLTLSLPFRLVPPLCEDTGAEKTVNVKRDVIKGNRLSTG